MDNERKPLHSTLMKTQLEGGTLEDEVMYLRAVLREVKTVLSKANLNDCVVGLQQQLVAEKTVNNEVLDKMASQVSNLEQRLNEAYLENNQMKAQLRAVGILKTVKV